MKNLLFIIFFSSTLHSFAQEEKSYKWLFHAGAANGLNFFEEPNTEDNFKITSYKKVSIGNGLGAELGYILPKKFSMWGNYYMYLFKNKVDNTFYPFITNFSLKQVTQNVAITFQYDILQKKNTNLYISTGGGLALENVQYYKESIIPDEYSISIGEYSNTKFLLPIKVGTSRIVKEHFILGASVQMFLYGSSQPFRTLNLFSYLGVRF